MARNLSPTKQKILLLLFGGIAFGFAYAPARQWRVLGDIEKDGKWRIVVFDIPEKKRHGRDALREKLCELGFYELQKSVLVFPYPCQDELDFLIEYFGLRRYVRVGILETIDNELHLKKYFQLL